MSDQEPSRANTRAISRLRSPTISGLFAAIGLMMMLIGCAGSEKSLRDKGLSPMSTSALTSLFETERTLAWSGPETGVSGTSTYRPGSTVEVGTSTGETDVGRYWVQDDGLLCARYSKIREGAERCFRVYQTGPNAYRLVTEAGAGDATFSIR